MEADSAAAASNLGGIDVLGVGDRAGMMSDDRLDASKSYRWRLHWSQVKRAVIVMQIQLRKRQWKAARRSVKQVLRLVRYIPVDMFKIMTEVARRSDVPENRLIRFYRKLNGLKIRGLLSQTQLYHQLVGLELAYMLCRSGRVAMALTHLGEKASLQPFASNPLYPGYSGMLAYHQADICLNGPSSNLVKIKTETAADISAPVDIKGTLEDARSLARDSRDWLEKACELLPSGDAFLFYHLKSLLLFGADPASIEACRKVLDNFIEGCPEHPNGHRLRLEFLTLYAPDDNEALLASSRALLHVDPVSEIAFDTLVKLYLLGHLSEKECWSACCERLTYLKRDCKAWKQLADIFRNSPVDCRPIQDLMPEPWWIRMHFRHPRALAKSLGLASNDKLHAKRISVLLLLATSDETKMQVVPSSSMVEFLCHMCVCAAYLLESSHRFVLDVKTALEQAGFHALVEQIRDECFLDIVCGDDRPTSVDPSFENQGGTEEDDEDADMSAESEFDEDEAQEDEEEDDLDEDAEVEEVEAKEERVDDVSEDFENPEKLSDADDFSDHMMEVEDF